MSYFALTKSHFWCSPSSGFNGWCLEGLLTYKLVCGKVDLGYIGVVKFERLFPIAWCFDGCEPTILKLKEYFMKTLLEWMKFSFSNLNWAYWFWVILEYYCDVQLVINLIIMNTKYISSHTIIEFQLFGTWENTNS